MTLPTYTLTLRTTYFEQGFFNLGVAVDQHVRSDSGPAILLVGDSHMPLEVFVNREANPNGTPRIIGGAPLKGWIQRNFRQGESIEIEILAPNRFWLGQNIVDKSQFIGHGQDNNTLKPLTNIGFRKVGDWHLQNDNLQLDLGADSESKNILYCLVVNGTPKYVGKTVRTLKKRMYNYLNPGARQKTSVRINGKLIETLRDGSTIELYVLPDHGLLHFGEFHLNLAAGLEDSIIRTISPEWNITGK